MSTSAPLKTSVFQIVLRLLLPYILLTLGLTLFVGHVAHERSQDMLQRRLTIQNHLRGDALARQLSALRGDALFLTETPPVQGIVRAALNNGLDAQERSTQTLWRERLNTIFSAFTAANPKLTRMRFISLADHGRELVRVDHQDGATRIIPADHLETLEDEELLAAMAQAPRGTVRLYLTGLADTVNGVALPNISASVPVYTPDGHVFGLILLEMDASRIATAFGADLPRGFQSYITDTDGRYLLRGVSDRTGWPAADPQRRWRDDFAVVEEQTQAQPEARHIYRHGQDLFHAVSSPIVLDSEVAPPPGAAAAPQAPGSHAITLIMIAPDDLITADVNQTRMMLLGGMGGTGLVMAGLLALYWQRGRRARNERAWLGAIVEGVSDAVIGKDLDGVVVTWNHGAEEMFGYTAREAVGRSLRDLIVPPEYEREETDILARVARGEQVPHFETVRHRKDGGLLDVSVSISPIRDAQGRIIGGAKTARDISRRKAVANLLRESEERLRLAADIAQLGQWELDPVGGAVIHSPEYDRIFGYDQAPENWSYKHFLEHVRPEDRIWVDQVIQTALNRKGALSFECQIHRRDGALRWISVHGRHYRDEAGNPTRVLGIVTDITEQKSTELHIRQLNETLEQEVVKRTAEIEEYSALQRAILKSAGNAIIATDTAGLIKVFNPAAVAMLGYSVEEMVGRRTPEIIHDAAEMVVQAAAFSAELGETIEPGFETFVAKSRRDLPNKYEWTYVRKDGGRVPVLLSVTAMRDEAGVITGFLGIASDISQQRRDKQELVRLSNRFKTAAMVAELGIWTLRLADQTMIWNDRMYEIHGVPKAADDTPLPETLWRPLIHPDDADRVMDELTATLAGRGTFSVTCRIVRPDGAVRHTLTAAVLERGPDGQPSHLVGIARDVTAQLEHEQSLQQAKNAADAANQAKSAFLANMSHEIRTPMNAILGMLQLLRQTELNGRQGDYVEKTESAARTLLALLNDILDFSKVEAGKLTLDSHPYNIDKLLRDVGVILSANIGSKEVEILFDVDPSLPPWISGDSLRLQQVLINLAGNAVKFTERGEIVVSARCEHRTDGPPRLAIAVRDTGIGIAPEHLGHLFQGFSQGESSTARRFGGTGLGLAISQRLVHLMGGEISVESTLGAGSTFRFTIPLEAADGPEALPPRTVANLLGLRVLIVDDNDTARRVLAGAVRSFGWSADEAANGMEALRQLTRRDPEMRRYDVVLVDWRMPDMDGWDTSVAIRRKFPKDDMPLIVMVTAYGREVLAQRQAQLPNLLDGFLVKPITNSMLFDAVADARARRGKLVAVPTPAASQRPAIHPLAGRHLLVVEDNLTNQQVARELLISQGASVDVADSGLSAIALLEAGQSYDLVLMDVQMPGMDGYTATRQIRERLGLRDLPIIAMTANAMPADRIAALAAGMNDHVAKPFNIRQLVEVINSHLDPAPGATEPPTTAPDAAADNAPDNAETAPTLSEPAPSAPPLSATPAPLDSDTALARLQGNHAIYQRVLRGFLAEAPDMLASLPALMAAGQEEDMRRVLHTLKGLAAMVGATTLADAAAHAERTPLAQLEATLPTVQGLTRTALQAVAQTLDTLLADKPVEADTTGGGARENGAHDVTDRPPPTLPPAPDARTPDARTTPLLAPALHDALNYLGTLLRDGNMSAVTVVEKLRQDHADALPPAFAMLEDAISRLDFQVAQEICGDMLTNRSHN